MVLLMQLLLMMYAKGMMQEYLEHTVVYILTIALLWWPVINTRYMITNDKLIIHSLLFKWDINLVDIQKIQRTDHLDASPALSLKRLKIEYLHDGKSKQVLVSPRDQQKFLDILKMPV